MTQYLDKMYEAIFRNSKLEETIENFIGLLENVSLNIFYKVQRFINKIFFLANGVHASIDSLNGVRLLCKSGNIVDSYLLARKIRDNLLLELFFLCDFENNNAPFNKDIDILDANGKIDTNKLEKHIVIRTKEIEEYNNDNRNKQAIKNWLENNLSKEDKKLFFDYRMYINNLKMLSSEFKTCHDDFLKSKFDEVSETLNNYVHSNGIIFLRNNMLSSKKSIIMEFQNIKQCFENIKQLFIISIFLISPLSLQSQDYVDSLENGEPYDEFKYYVISYALTEFENIRDSNKALFDYLEKNNRYDLYIKQEDYM